MEDNVAFFSICIPAYKNTDYLKRLLDSIAIQTFRDFEVIITDDSPDETVSTFINNYNADFSIQYFKNDPVLGTPENWNEGIRKSKGKWIKMMHDDDWFATSTALQVFYDATYKYPEVPFFFAAFQNITQETGAIEKVFCSKWDLMMLKWSPLHLFKKVYVGNPSCTLVKRDVNMFYDRNYKFVVDFEYYIQVIRKFKAYQYIDQLLINVGFNALQVTKYTFKVAAVQVPENISLLNKLGPQILRNILVYDYYWRMWRNLGVRGVADCRRFYSPPIPQILVNMMNQQALVPLNVLKIGMVSKVMMFFSYVLSLFVSTNKG
ncbi:MAG: glycosyltransferase [Chitinophagaceae bacterium]|nr:glycosyltransferase [Chitinophagaceae bacterium]